MLCLAAVLCAVSGGYVAGPAALVRAPSFDSVIIKSDRLGDNLAYSTAESHAYVAISLVVQNVVSPVGVSYTASPIAAPVVAYAAPPGRPRCSIWRSLFVSLDSTDITPQQHIKLFYSYSQFVCACMDSNRCVLIIYLLL